MEEIEYKFSVDWTKPDFFCGLDVHKYELSVAVFSRDRSGAEFLKHNVFRTDSQGLDCFWRFVRKYRPQGFIMEATGVYHHHLYEFLAAKREKASWPFKIIVANPADASGIPGRQKNDKIDAEHLARYLAAGLFKEGKPIIKVLEDLKALFRSLARIEKDRTALKNRVKKTLDRAGIRPKGLNFNTEWVCELTHAFIERKGSLGDFLDEFCSDNSFLKKHRAVILKNISKFLPYRDFSLSSAQKALIRQNLVDLEFKTARKVLSGVEIDLLISELPGLRRYAHNLSSIPSISAFSAVWIMAEIGNVEKFPTCRQLLAYCGCCPRIVSSAGKVYSAHVSRHSNKYLRTLFCNAASVVCNQVKRDSELKRYAKRVMAKKGDVSKTLVYNIVAAKLVKIVHAILRDGVPFDPDGGVKDPSTKYSGGSSDFSVSERKDMRRASRMLRHIRQMEDIGRIGIESERLAEELDKLLIQKNNPVD